MRWRAEYDVFFDDADDIRRYVDDVESGSGHWSQTYTLRSLALMFELTGDVAYLHELIYQGDRILGAAVDDSWPTGVCGNAFAHSTVVIDGLLLYPLLRAAWWMQTTRLADDPIPDFEGVDYLGQTYGEKASAWAEAAARTLAGHDASYRTTDDDGYYVFPGSYTCVAGEVMPFNYSSAAAKAYAALHRLTGEADARQRAEALHGFWWNRTYAYTPSPDASRSRWWGYRGVVAEAFDPDAFPGDADHRPEDVGHADHTSDMAGTIRALGLAGQNATRIDQVALASKRWVDRAVAADSAPAYYITNDDEDGLWSDLYDHLPMSCYRQSIWDDLDAAAEEHLTGDSGDFRRAFAENLAELAFFAEYAGTDPACAPACGDARCSGPEDCVSCPDDCGACPVTCGR